MTIKDSFVDRFHQVGHQRLAEFFGPTLKLAHEVREVCCVQERCAVSGQRGVPGHVKLHPRFIACNESRQSDDPPLAAWPLSSKYAVYIRFERGASTRTSLQQIRATGASDRCRRSC